MQEYVVGTVHIMAEQDKDRKAGAKSRTKMPDSCDLLLSKNLFYFVNVPQPPDRMSTGDEKHSET